MSRGEIECSPGWRGLAKEAELWIGAQGDVLAGIETMIAGWAQRQRQVLPDILSVHAEDL